MSKMSKRHKENQKLVEQGKEYSFEDAVAILKNAGKAKFDETVEIAINLKIDTTRADQLVRGSFSFPHGVGKTVRVIAIVEDSLTDDAKAAGACEAGNEDLIKRIEEGWLDFDVAIAHPSMMRHIGKLGRLLGPKGLMPSPKSGTVTDKVPEAIKEFAAGKIEFRNDKLGNLMAPVGKISFEESALCENIKAFYGHIVSIRPQAVKGIFIKSVYISSTMGPGLKIAI